MKKVLHFFAFIICFFYFFAISTDQGDALKDWSCTYLEPRFVEKIKKEEVQTIVELGSYNGLDSILLHLHYNCPVFAFECDSVRLEEIKKRFEPYPAIKLYPYGAWHETKNMIFYHSSFSGASSFYEFDLDSLAKINHSSVEEVVEKQNLKMHPIEVDAIRLDEWMEKVGIKQIDLLCMDVQGACLNALVGLGERLNDVKYIITEVEYIPVYQDEPLFPEIKKYLQERGFKCFFERDETFSDVMFINEKYL